MKPSDEASDEASEPRARAHSEPTKLFYSLHAVVTNYERNESVDGSLELIPRVPGLSSQQLFTCSGTHTTSNFELPKLSEWERVPSEALNQKPREQWF